MDRKIVNFILCVFFILIAAKVPPHIKRALPAADVILDAGHGGIDGGTHWEEIKEKDLNLAIAKKMYLILRAKKKRVILNRTGDYALSEENRWHFTPSRHTKDLAQRKGLSEEIGANLFISIHVNWSKNRNRHGPLVIHQKLGASSLLASQIQNCLNHAQRTSRLPRSANKFYLLNRVQIPSVIVETGFLSNPNDRKMLMSVRGQTKIAEAIATGIIAYQMLQFND